MSEQAALPIRWNTFVESFPVNNLKFNTRVKRGQGKMHADNMEVDKVPKSE